MSQYATLLSIPYLAFTVLHDQIGGKVLDKVVGVVAKRLSVECVEESMAGSVRCSTASVSLATLAEFLTLSTKGSLVTLRLSVSMKQQVRGVRFLHLAIFGTREWTSIVLEFVDTSWCLSGHVVNRVLVSEPIRTLDGVVHVPSPVILVHAVVTESASLLSYGCFSFDMPYFPRAALIPPCAATV